MEKKKEKESWAGEIVSVLTNVYMFSMLLVFPLFYRDKLYDIFQAKRDFFFLVVIVFLTASAFFLLSDRTEWPCEKKDRKTVSPEGKVTGFSGVVLCVSVLFTVLVNPDRGNVFWGVDVTRVGAATLLTGVLSAFLIGRYLKWNAVLTWAFLLGSGGVFLLQILNEWRIDPLGMYETMLKEQIAFFSSTIGNVNFNASYDSVVLPAGMALFVLCRERVSEWVYGFFLFLGFCGMICCRSDSILLTLFILFLVLFEFVLRSREGMKKCIDIVLIFLGSGSVTGIFYHLWNENANGFLGGLSVLFIDKRVIGTELFILSVLFVLRWKGMDFFTEKRIKIMRRMFHMIFFAFILLIFVVSFWATSKGTDATAGTFFQYFVLSDRWGSDRGYVFRRAIGLYRDYPLSRKLFGCGPDNLPTVLNAAYGEEMQMFMGNLRFKDCHNEFLQILVSFGAVGAAGYFGMIFSVLLLCIRQFPENEAAIAGILGLSGYLAQGLVNSPTIAVVPMLFLELGILCRVSGLSDQTEPEQM